MMPTNKSGVISYDITVDEQTSLDLWRKAEDMAKRGEGFDAEARKRIGDGLRIEAEGEAMYKKGLAIYCEAETTMVGTKAAIGKRLAEGYHMKAEGARVTSQGRRTAALGRKMLAEAALMTRQAKKMKREAKKMDARIAAGLPVNTLTD